MNDVESTVVWRAFDTATCTKPLGGAADAGVMQIQLSESRFGGVPGWRRRAQQPSGREEEKKDWLDSKTESEVVSRGTQKFRNVRHANSRLTLDVYAQALTPAKRAAHLKVVELIRPAAETRSVPLCSHAEEGESVSA